MRNRFGETFNAKLRHNIFSTIAVLLFVAALVCVIVALVKAPPTPKNPSASNPGSQTKPPVSSSDKTDTLKDISLETAITDETGEMTINQAADALLRQFIMEASAREDTAYNVTSIQDVRFALFDNNSANPGIFSAQLNANTWFVNGTAKLVFEGNMNTDDNGEVSLGGRYVVKVGRTYTMYPQAEFEAKNPDDVPAFNWGEYDTSTAISTQEMTTASGIKLASTYEQVEAKVGGFDTVDTSTARVREAKKNGYTFTFSLVDSSSTTATDWGLPHDGKYYLTQIVADDTCKDEFPRGIKIGDSIENVFTKFPTANTKLQKWAEQRLYGAQKYEERKTYCYLEFRTRLGTYRIVAQDKDRDYISIVFDTNNNVKSFEWIYRQ